MEVSYPTNVNDSSTKLSKFSQHHHYYKQHYSTMLCSQHPNRILIRNTTHIRRNTRHTLISSSSNPLLRPRRRLSHPTKLLNLPRNLQQLLLRPLSPQNLHTNRHAIRRSLSSRTEADRHGDHGCAGQSCQDSIAAALGRRADFDDEVLLLGVDDGI